MHFLGWGGENWVTKMGIEGGARARNLTAFLLPLGREEGSSQIIKSKLY